MNETFSIIARGSLSLLVYTPWMHEGILHGMTLRPFSLGSGDPGSNLRELYEATGIAELANPRQTHGNLVFDVRNTQDLEAYRALDGSLTRFGEFDALITPTARSGSSEKLGFGIATADCVPVVMRGVSGWGLVHAGWRGLANGIIGRAAEALGEIREVAIFACAGGATYEVGREVIDAIGESVVYQTGTSGSLLLDTAETARQQLLPYVDKKRIETSGICTIADTRFHSHRRDGATAGRSITFLSPS